MLERFTYLTLNSDWNVLFNEILYHSKVVFQIFVVLLDFQKLFVKPDFHFFKLFLVNFRESKSINAVGIINYSGLIIFELLLLVLFSWVSWRSDC